MADYYHSESSNYQQADNEQGMQTSYQKRREKPVPGSNLKHKMDVLSTKVFVGYLTDTMRKKDIQDLFAQYGTVVECDIVKDYAFVHFKTIKEAKAAVDALDGTTFMDSKLNVQISVSRVRQRAGMGNGENCYRCGSPDHWTKNCPRNPKRQIADDDRQNSRRDDRRDDRYDRRDPYDRRLPAASDPRDPYYDYYRGRYPPPPADRYRPYPSPYARPPLPPPAAPAAREYYDPKDPYARPPPEFYKRKQAASRDPYGRY